MPNRSLADFLEELGQAGELDRVEAEVDPVLEVAEITARNAGSDGPALLFTRVKGHDFPLVTNLLGTEGRICRALGVASLAEAAGQIERLVQPAGPEGWLERLKIGGPTGGLAGLAPRQVRAAACQQIVRLASDVDLGVLPAVQSAPREAGRTITAAALVAAEPDSHRQVGGRYDVQVLARDRLAVCWAAHDGPARLLAEYGRRNVRMPVAVVLGGDPACLLAASALVSAEAEPLVLAGLLRDEAIDAVACRTVDLQVPAQADIVIEGHIDPAEPPVEAWPLCSPIVYYTAPRPVPAMHVTAITHRANPICPAVIRLTLPNEACLVDRALAKVFGALVKLAIPELVDFDLPLSGAARFEAVLAIRKTYAGQARRVASTAWGLRQFLAAKMLVVVDDGVAPGDPGQVSRAIAAHVNPGRDVFYQQGPPDPLDPATPPGTLGQKMGIDATAKLPEEYGGA